MFRYLMHVKLHIFEESAKVAFLLTLVSYKRNRKKKQECFIEYKHFLLNLIPNYCQCLPKIYISHAIRTKKKKKKKRIN